MIYQYDLKSSKILVGGKEISVETFLKDSTEKDLLLVDAEISVFNEELENFYGQIESAKANVNLSINFEKSYIDDEKEISRLQEISDFCLSKNIQLKVELKRDGSSFPDSADYQKFVIAKQKIDDFVQKLKDFEEKKKNQGEELSVIEKYFIVYKFVANRVYNMDKDNFLNDDMRNWIGVLSTDKVICSGFASLLKCVCDRVFKANELQCYEQSCEVYDGNNNFLGAHALNIVRIRDKKYGYDGILNSDSCWGANKQNGEGNYAYCLNPLQIYGMMSEKKFEFRNLWLYKEIENVEYHDDFSFDFYVEHELLADLLKENGLKSLTELNNEANITEQLQLKKEQIEKSNAQKNKEAQIKIKNFFKKYNLTEFKKFKLPTIYPKNKKEEYPILQHFEDLIQGKDIPDEEEFADALKQVLELYKTDEKLFEDLNKVIKEMHLEEILTPIGKICEDRFKENVEYFDEYNEKNKINKEIETKYLQEYQQLIKKAHKLIHSNPIPQKALKNGLRAVAEFCGMSEEKVNSYIEKEMEKIKIFKTKLNLSQEEQDKFVDV